MDLQVFLDDFLHTGGFQILTRDVYELFGCPVMIVDVAFRVISWHHSGDFQDKPFQGTVDSGELSYEIGSAFLGELSSSREKPHFIKLKDSRFRRRVSLLKANDIHVGYLILVDVQGKLEQEDPQTFFRVETILAKQLLTHLSQDSQLKDSEEAVLLHLLEGKFVSEPLFRLQAEAAGLSRHPPVRFALMDLELYQAARHPENALRNAIHRQFPDSRALLFNHNLLIFLRKEPSQKKAEEFCRRYSVRMVLSPRMHNLFHLPQAYASTHEILEFLIQHVSGHFAVYGELLYGLMMFRHLSSRRDLILPSVRAMGRHDREEDTRYCLTLYTYLCCHHSLQETCTQLFTHRNTVLYRIRKMREEYGIPLDDSGQHAALLMSCALMLLSNDPDALLPPQLR